MLSPRRAPNLGKVRRRSCLRLIPLPGAGDVLLPPTMISHPLAYVAPTTQHILLISLQDHNLPHVYFQKLQKAGYGIDDLVMLG